MANYQPFVNYVTTYLTGVQNAMSEWWDPQIYETSFRYTDATKYFKPITQQWPAGPGGVKRMYYRVNDVRLRTGRFNGPGTTEASNIGTVLPNPANIPTADQWQINENDLMMIWAGARREFKTSRLIDLDRAAMDAFNLSQETLGSAAERTELAIVTGQSGGICKIKQVMDDLEAYSSSAGYTDGQEEIRLYVDNPQSFDQGDVIDLYSSEGNAQHAGVTVTNWGYEHPATGVYGYLDIDGSTGTGRGGETSSTFDYLADIIAAGSAVYCLFSGEYSSGHKPGGAPVLASSAKVMYGLQDWIQSETGSGSHAPGVIYNITRTTAGDQWACPIVLDKNPAGTSGSDVTLRMSHIDELLLAMCNMRRNRDKVGPIVIMAGPAMLLKMTELCAVAHRIIDNNVGAGQRLMATYGFDGVWIRSPVLSAPVAVQMVRGLPEDRIYAVDPGFLKLIQPGGIQTLPGGDAGGWVRETYTSGSQGGISQTTVFRLDRVGYTNSLVVVPRRAMAALLGVKAD